MGGAQQDVRDDTGEGKFFEVPLEVDQVTQKKL